MIALSDLVAEAYHETNPASAEAKAEEAIALSRLLQRLIPEVRDLLDVRPQQEMVQ